MEMGDEERLAELNEKLNEASRAVQEARASEWFGRASRWNEARVSLVAADVRRHDGTAVILLSFLVVLVSFAAFAASVFNAFGRDSLGVGILSVIAFVAATVIGVRQDEKPEYVASVSDADVDAKAGYVLSETERDLWASYTEARNAVDHIRNDIYQIEHRDEIEAARRKAEEAEAARRAEAERAERYKHAKPEDAEALRQRLDACVPASLRTGHGSPSVSPKKANRKNGTVCPKCGSHNTMPIASTKKLSAGRAVVGGVAFGAVGAVVGATSGHNSKVEFICRDCGRRWKI